MIYEVNTLDFNESLKNKENLSWFMSLLEGEKCPIKLEKKTLSVFDDKLSHPKPYPWTYIFPKGATTVSWHPLKSESVIILSFNGP